ncbi:putative auxin efflux carrier component 3-like [Capsicum annuum]|nr:putative auxin efflux carrier component 3-like [Capsicum annuum]
MVSEPLLCRPCRCGPEFKLSVGESCRAGLGPERTISLVGWDVTGVSRACVVRNARHGQDLGSDRDNHLGFVFRFENEALCWERRSSFTHNRYLKEVEKYIKPGSVTEKKAYFEELFRRRALLSQSSSDCQDGADSQAIATLLENGKYQASENEGYAGRFEHVNEVGHSARFDENYDSSTHLSKNEKYQAKNTGYDGDSERVNKVGDSARFEESFDGSNNEDIEVTEYGGEGSRNGDIEVTEYSGEDSISCHSGPQTEQDTNSSDVLQSAPELLEAEAKFNLMLEIQLLMIQSTEEQPIARKIEEKVHAKEKETGQLQPRTQEKKEAEIKQLWRNLNFKATPIPAFYREPDHRSEKIKVSSGSKANVLNQHKSTEEQPIARKVVASRAFCTEKVSHRLYQRVNRDKESVNSCQPVVKQNGSRKEEAEIKQLRRNLNFKATPMPAFYREPGRRSEENKDGQIWEDTGARAVELASKTKSQSRPTTAAGARATSATENTVRCLSAEIYNRCSTNERLNMADSPQVSEVTIHPSADLSYSNVPSAATSKTSKQTQSNRTVAPKREQEKRQVANSPRPRTSDSIRRNKDFKVEDKIKVLARRTGNHAT